MALDADPQLPVVPICIRHGNLLDARIWWRMAPCAILLPEGWCRPSLRNTRIRGGGGTSDHRQYLPPDIGR